VVGPPLVAESAATHVFPDAEHPVDYWPVGVQRVLSAIMLSLFLAAFLVLFPSSAIFVTPAANILKYLVFLQTMPAR
jgi:hypothetical protein